MIYGFVDVVGTRITAHSRYHLKADITGFLNLSVHFLYLRLVTRQVQKIRIQNISMIYKKAFCQPRTENAQSPISASES